MSALAELNPIKTRSVLGVRVIGLITFAVPLFHKWIEALLAPG